MPLKPVVSFIPSRVESTLHTHAHAGRTLVGEDRTVAVSDVGRPRPWTTH